MKKKNRSYFFMVLIIALCGCSQKNSTQSDWENNSAPQSPEDRRKFGFGSLVGSDGFTLSSTAITGRHHKNQSMRVNGYLWSAALSVLDFMPLVSSDAHGGVLVTDWTSLDHNPKEQTKITVHIKGCDLNANALSVTTYKRVFSSNGLWINKNVDPQKNHDLEMLILEKARTIKSTSNNSCH
jgi:hypothetical protein